MRSPTVVTFRADGAEAWVARFTDWAGGAEVEDLGTLDGLRRYRVPAGLWRRYTHAVTQRAAPAAPMLMYRCGSPACRVRATAGGLANHQRASGHEGREDSP